MFRIHELVQLTEEWRRASKRIAEIFEGAGADLRRDVVTYSMEGFSRARCLEGVSEPRAVATGSGRAAKFISAQFAVILVREVSFLIQGDFLIRSLPLAVLTHF